MVKVTARRKSRFEPFLRGTKTFKWASERRYSAFVSVAVLPLGLVPEMTYFNHGLLVFLSSADTFSQQAYHESIERHAFSLGLGLQPELQGLRCPLTPHALCRSGKLVSMLRDAG